MRRDDGIHLIGANSHPLQGMKQALRLAQSNLQSALLAQLRADACLANNHLSVHTSDETDTRHIDHVVAVGRLLLLPQNLGDDAEHQTAVGLPSPRDEDVKL
jgi:hypothetical protein